VVLAFPCHWQATSPQAGAFFVFSGFLFSV
jgi:hypothetical protein